MSDSFNTFASEIANDWHYYIVNDDKESPQVIEYRTEETLVLMMAVLSAKECCKDVDGIIHLGGPGYDVCTLEEGGQIDINRWAGMHANRWI